MPFPRSSEGHANCFSQAAPSRGWVVRALSTSSNAGWELLPQPLVACPSIDHSSFPSPAAPETQAQLGGQRVLGAYVQGRLALVYPSPAAQLPSAPAWIAVGQKLSALRCCFVPRLGRWDSQHCHPLSCRAGCSWGRCWVRRSSSPCVGLSGWVCGVGVCCDCPGEHLNFTRTGLAQEQSFLG